MAFGINQTYRRITKGFSIAAIKTDLPNRKEWAGSLPDDEIRALFKQTFSYYSQGSQSFVFISEDQNYVIKFFKHHRWRLSPFLEHLPLPAFLQHKRGLWKLRKLETIEDTYRSALISYNEFKEETGLLYIHLNKTNDLKEVLHIQDSLGFKHDLQLDNIHFVVQKKAESIPTTLLSLKKAGDLKKAKALIKEMINFSIYRREQGYNDKDPHFIRNFGLIQGKIIQIDIGGFYQDPKKGMDYFYGRELTKIKNKLMPWIKKNYSELVGFVSDEFRALQSHEAPQMAEKQILRINFCYQPFTVDPRKCSDPASCILNFMLYEGLTHLEPDGSITLSTAESFTVSPNKKKYTFILKETFWSDGSPVTAYDFEASWKSLIDPKFPSTTAHLLYPIKNAKAAREKKVPLDQVGIFAKDDRTLVVELEKPTPYFLKLTSFCTYYPIPKEKVAMETIWDAKKESHLISNGPFRMKKWKYNNEIIVKKNPLFWKAKDVKLNRIFITLIQDESTAFKLYEQGKLDWIGGFISPIPLDALPALIEQNLLNHKEVAGTSFCAFNLNCYPFSNSQYSKGF